jgi:hypothetical protein
VEPCIRIKRLFGLIKKWGLRAEEVLVTSREMFIMTSLLMAELVLLFLH